jgi:hypothetical protein
MLAVVTHADERRTSAIGLAACDVDVELLRGRLRWMSDPELLRFGIALKFQSSLEANLDRPLQERASVQLHEARDEWKARHPRLPLRDSF